MGANLNSAIIHRQRGINSTVNCQGIANGHKLYLSRCLALQKACSALNIARPPGLSAEGADARLRAALFSGTDDRGVSPCTNQIAIN